MGRNKELKKFRRTIRKEEQRMFNDVMNAINALPFWERAKWAWKVIRGKC